MGCIFVLLPLFEFDGVVLIDESVGLWCEFLQNALVMIWCVWVVMGFDVWFVLFRVL